jgi:hypothetical protein
MGSKTIIVAGAVFAAVFSGVLFIPFDQLLKPSPPSRTFGPLTGRVEATFHQVPKDDRPQAVKDAEFADVQVKNSAVYAKLSGEQIRPEAEVRAAVDDAPKQANYVAYAALPEMSLKMIETHDIDATGMKVACFSARQSEANSDEDGPAAPQSLHQIILYDQLRFIPIDQADLYAWVYSGCAKATKSSPTISRTQYKAKLREMLPATPDYEPLRQHIAQSLNSKTQDNGGLIL